MKRTRRWLLMFAALIGLMAHVGALRGTSYIRQTTSTTTTKATTTTEKTTTEEEITEVPVTESINTTKSNLTGIPQIDYIWDPNLPRELNGYNLSDYPFLNSVPIEDEIGFKCDDALHDGFYASIKYNCQLYHHCISGVRYDFLCANFTAFDQRTFICHFASEVDCQNSAKYWFRNDALYWLNTTTTTRPIIYAPPQTLPPIRPRPLRRPLRRRRPQADYYYDDEDYEDYEDRPTKRRKQRPRNRRPEYDEYDNDERYDRRGSVSSTERNRNRQEDDEYDYERRANDRPRYRGRPGGDSSRNNEEFDRRKISEDDRKPIITDDRRTSEVDKRTSDKRHPPEDRRKQTYDDRRPINDDRRPINDDRRQINDDRRPLNDDRRAVVSDRRPISDDRRPVDEDRRSYNERRKNNDDRRSTYDDPPRRTADRPERPYRREEETNDRPLKRPYKEEIIEEPQGKVKPTASGSASGSIFDRPRVAPRIRRPVPVNARSKFDYSTIKPGAAEEESDYYDEYEEPLPLPPKPKAPIREEPKVDNKRKLGGSIRRPEPVEPVKKPIVQEDDYYEDEYEEKPKTPVQKPPKNNREIIREEEIVDDPKTTTRLNVREKFPFRENPRNTAVKLNQKDGYNQGSTDVKEREVISTDSRETSFTSFKPKFDRFSSKESTPISPKEAYKPILRESIKRDPFRQTEDREQYTYAEKELFPIKPSQNPDNIRIAFRTPYDHPMIRSNYEEEIIREPRPVVRVVKRPFLPSRGGSPYLPRGLQPLGGSQSDIVTEGIDSNPPSVKLSQQSASSLRDYEESDYESGHQKKGPRTTQKPKVESQKNPLDEIYDSEYDVTLNDALNPTLKPLTSSLRGSPVGFTSSNKFDRNRLSSIQYSPPELSYSPSQKRPTAIRAPISRSSSYSLPSSSDVYDDYDY